MARLPHKICPDLLLSRCRRREKMLEWCSRTSPPLLCSWDVIFARYEELRRKRIDVAYDEANLRWETNKDFGWLAQSMKRMVDAYVSVVVNQSAEQSIR